MLYNNCIIRLNVDRYLYFINLCGSLKFLPKEFGAYFNYSAGVGRKK